MRRRMWVPPSSLGVSQKSIDHFNTLSESSKIHYCIHAYNGHGGTTLPEVGEGGRVMTGAQTVLARVYFGHALIEVEWTDE